MVSAGI